jgi:hypothetical protein
MYHRVWDGKADYDLKTSPESGRHSLSLPTDFHFQKVNLPNHVL